MNFQRRAAVITYFDTHCGYYDGIYYHTEDNDDQRLDENERLGKSGYGNNDGCKNDHDCLDKTAGGNDNGCLLYTSRCV